jgi:hypothetical protein
VLVSLRRELVTQPIVTVRDRAGRVLSGKQLLRKVVVAVRVSWDDYL